MGFAILFHSRTKIPLAKIALTEIDPLRNTDGSIAGVKAVGTEAFFKDTPNVTGTRLSSDVSDPLTGKSLLGDIA